MMGRVAALHPSLVLPATARVIFIREVCCHGKIPQAIADIPRRADAEAVDAGAAGIG